MKRLFMTECGPPSPASPWPVAHLHTALRSLTVEDGKRKKMEANGGQEIKIDVFNSKLKGCTQMRACTALG